jgi:hypothetical protein
MLHLAGADMDAYTSLEWQATAHTAAALLQGSEITLGLLPLPTLPQHQQQDGEEHGTDPSGPQQQAQRDEAQALSRQAQHEDRPIVGGEGKAERDADATHAVNLEGDEWKGRDPEALALRMGQDVESAPRRVRRWVETQQALFESGRLSSAQLRYMKFLGAGEGGGFACDDALVSMHAGSFSGSLQGGYLIV